MARCHIAVLLPVLGVLVSADPVRAEPAGDALTVAVLPFQNKTFTYHLKSYETLVPAAIREHLSRHPEVTVVDLEARAKLIEELEFRLSDLAANSDALDGVGEMLDARFVIAGTLTRSAGRRIRIDARIIEVATGRISVERVSGREHSDLSPMLNLLGQNLAQNLTGRGVHQSSARFTQYPHWYLGGVTLGLIATAFGLDLAYDDKRDAYRDAERLDDIRDRYDDTNALWHARNSVIAASVMTGIAAVVLTFVHYRAGNRIDASPPATEELLAPKTGAGILERSQPDPVPPPVTAPPPPPAAPKPLPPLPPPPPPAPKAEEVSSP